MTKARNLSLLSAVEAGATTDQTKADLNAIGVSGGRKNIIINGDNRISQRGVYTSATTVVHNTYYLDRWKAVKGGSCVATLTRSSDVINGITRKTQLYTVTTGAGSSYTGGTQSIEFPEDLIGRIVTISAWVKSNSTNAHINIYAVGTNASVGHTGGGDWEHLTATVALPSGITAMKLWAALISASTGAVTTTTGDYIEFGDVQLELGSVATDFEHRSYGEELALCQRYCYAAVGQAGIPFIAGVAYSTTGLYMIYNLPVPPRVAPTITISGTFTISDQYANDYNSSNATALGANNNLANGRVRVDGLGGLTVGKFYGGAPNTVGTTIFDAEL